MPSARSPEIDSHVPSSAHYDAVYLGNGRSYSLATQLAELLAVGPRTVLEVGVGSGIAAFALRQAGIEVTTLDVQDGLRPDLVADVRAIPRADRAFDAVSCCQVLEHLPYADFPAAIAELARVTDQRLVLSLPDLTRWFGVTLSLASRGLRSFGFSLPVPDPGAAWRQARLEAMGHYWEIGLDGITAGSIAATVRAAGFARVRMLRVRELPWHRFFIADRA